MKKLLAIFIAVVLFLPLAFGQSEEESIFDDKLWKADDPRTANPLNLYNYNNPLNPVNKYRPDNDYNPINQFKPDNPLNFINQYNPNNMLNPLKQFHPDSPLNFINRYRSPYNPPKEGMFKSQYKSYTPKSYTVPQYEVPGLSDPLDSLLDDLWVDTPY